MSVLGTPAQLDPSGPRYRGSDGWTSIGLKVSVPQEDSVLHSQSTYTSHPGAGGALGPHRGEDISIEAFDGHWPASIGRVWGTRPGRSPRTSGRSPRGSLLPPLLLAFFLLPDPHELHSPSLPADDHCRGMGTGDSSSHSSSLSPLPPSPRGASGFHSPLPMTHTSTLLLPFLVSHLQDGTSQFFFSRKGTYVQPPSATVVAVPTLRPWVTPRPAAIIFQLDSCFLTVPFSARLPLMQWFSTCGSNPLGETTLS